MTHVPDIDSFADRFTAAVPRLDPSEQRIALTLLRQPARGEPVSIGRLADAAELTEADTTAAVERLPTVYRDDHQQIVGFNGLAAGETGHHRIHLDGRELSAWCAYDTLFLPELLGEETVGVTSRSPASGPRLLSRSPPRGQPTSTPPGTVVSLLLPEGEFDANMIQSFCHFVHFFASPADGEAWVSEHPGTFLVSLQDAHRLGRLTNRARFGAAIAGNGGTPAPQPD